jgi:uncharacterized protein (DUF433 family)/DNA-binding transcriptional MerR regulator
MTRHPKTDPRDMPAYTIGEAAHYLSVLPQTVRYWAVGRDDYLGLIDPPSRSPVLLSFLNLVELHVIAAIRRQHKVTLPKIRSAIEYLEELYGDHHPLIRRELETDGLDLFVEHTGKLLNISRQGQTAMREILDAALKRIERDESGIPIKLYPFTRQSVVNAPAMVVIDPKLSAGRPVIKGTGLSTEVIAERYKAGDSISNLAVDYGRTQEEIEEAIRCELQLAA